ncbi:MAG: hypothetical protein GTN97_02205 [Nitrosopumilaceae archaeon]|nr:hypothetical protein [Nitrosopumilaceae archaeon]NIP09965.1 hypothetical protein [Nitrosopumilaceae archaeon]NIS94736.1 hypothetical protein [Nitrosopumilaceae archaeon]
MWAPLIVQKSDLHRVNCQSLISSDVPAIILKGFYDKKSCHSIVNKIMTAPGDYQKKNLKHIGPFLMSYATNKMEYFIQAKKTQKKFSKIFSQKENPTKRIFNMLKMVFPESKINLANEYGKKYSPFVIRIHELGKSIPVHKDHVGYEGKEYSISNIDYQLSCVLHLQESEHGGDLVIYNKNWKKTDEKYRKIEFGYSSKVVTSEKSCKISNLEPGDLVLINPIQYHEVTMIQGPTPRITLGMFLGFSNNEKKIISWA